MLPAVFLVSFHAIISLIWSVIMTIQKFARHVWYYGRQDIAVAALYIWFWFFLFWVWVLCIVSGERMEIHYLLPQLPQLTSVLHLCQFSVHFLRVPRTVFADG